MDIEYEATFPNIDKDDIRTRLEKAGAHLAHPEFTIKRKTFKLPESSNLPGSWLRVRDEDDKVTMSLKVVDGDRIENQKEIQLKIDDFDSAVKFLETIGCEKKSYQVTRREIWELESVEIMIDEWPFLEPFVEVEGKSEKSVKEVSEKLGFDYSKALFCAVATLYNLKYGISEEVINNNTSKIVFDMENPFIK